MKDPQNANLSVVQELTLASNKTTKEKRKKPFLCPLRNYFSESSLALTLDSAYDSLLYPHLTAQKTEFKPVGK